MSQPEFGSLGGVKKLAQINYETGKRSPDAAYLAGVHKAGADIYYIVTGERRSSSTGALDTALLQQVLEGVDEALQLRRQRLSATKKAELIGLLYEHFKEVKNVERGTVERFLRLVA